MKQIKFLAMAFTLLMGLTMSSCLNSDGGGSTFDAAGYFRVMKSYMGGYIELRDFGGTKYIPTQASVASMKEQGLDLNAPGVDLVFLYIKFIDNATAQNPVSERQVELMAGEAYYSAYTERAETLDELSTMNESPIVTLHPMSINGLTQNPLVLGSEMLVLPIQWRMENKKETLKQHTFQLHYVEGQSESETSNDLVLFLTHDRGTDDKYEVNANSTRAFDIKQYMELFKLHNGQYPQNVVIKSKNAQDGKTMPKEWTETKVETSTLNQSHK